MNEQPRLLPPLWHMSCVSVCICVCVRMYVRNLCRRSCTPCWWPQRVRAQGAGMLRLRYVALETSLMELPHKC